MVCVRCDKGLSEGTGDGENGQIRKVLSRKTQQASKTVRIANLL